MPGFQSHRRTRTRSDISPKLRRRVLARDGGRCQIRWPGCLGEGVEVDHIIPHSEGGSIDLENLQAVCIACHKHKTQTEAQRARTRLGRKRAPYPRFGMR